MESNFQIIIDTGPLVAFLNQRDFFHEWAKKQLTTIVPPLITCEAVLSEACFLLRKIAGAEEALFECINRKLISIPFILSNEIVAIQHLIKRYKNISMSLADACLVRLSENYSESKILTLNSDFKIYRRHGRQVIPTLMPSSW